MKHDNSTTREPNSNQPALTDDTDKRPMPRSVRSWLGGLLVLHTLAVLVLWRGSWFTVDAWDFFGKPPLSLDTLLLPHQDHLQPLQTLTFSVLKQAVGVAYFPAYVVPRLAAYGFLAIAIAWIMWQRTGSRALTLLSGGFVLFMSNTSWNIDAQFGGPTAIAAILLSAWVISETTVPTLRTRAYVAALLGLAIVAGSVGLLGTLVTLGAVTISRKRWRYIISAFIPSALYGLWAVGYREGTIQGRLPTVSELATSAWTIAQDSARLIIGIKVPIVGWVAILIILSLVHLIIKRRFLMFDFIAVATATIYVAAVTYSRFVNGFANIHHPRFSHNVVLLTMVTVVFAVSLVTIRWKAVAVPVAAAFLAVAVTGNLYYFVTEAIDQNRVQQANRALAEQFADLIEDGEPVAVPDRRLHPRLGGDFDAELVEELTPEYWSPRPAADAALEITARGHMRINVWPAGVRRGDVEISDNPTGQSCSQIEEDTASTVRLVNPAVVSLFSDDPTGIFWRSIDEYGIGEQFSPSVLFSHPFKQGEVFVTLVGTPDATIELTTRDSDVLLCAGEGPDN